MARTRDYSPGWRLFTKIIIPPSIRVLLRPQMSGRENFPRRGGLILAGNHLSYADWPVMAVFSYKSGHYPVFTIKSTVFNVKVIGTLLRKFGQLPVHRGRADAALVLKEAEQRISRGACVIFYPEGTASRDPDHWPMVARTGVARLALTTGVPVVPVACWGTQKVLPYGSKRPQLFRYPVKIAAGPPVDLSAFAGQAPTAETLRAVTNAIMTDVTKLLGTLRGERPPAEFYDPRAARAAAGTAEADGVAEVAGADEAAGVAEVAGTGEAAGVPGVAEAGGDADAAGKAQRG